MKNYLKYFFSILLMLSCLILFSMVSYKVLFLEDEKPPKEPEVTEENNENPPVDNKNHEKPKDDDEVKFVKPEDAPFATVDKSYFKDVLFIGDSRTVGLFEYGQIEGANFFANTGMNVYNVREKTVSVSNLGNVTLDKLLSSKQYGKIYLMLGINELGYDMDQTVKKYKELVDWLREKNPNGILYIEANMHVAAARSDKDEIFNNKRIDKFNSRIAEFIDNKNIFYIDVNELFDDEKGNLGAEYTSDNTHVLGKYYAEWVDWLLTKAIVLGENN